MAYFHCLIGGGSSGGGYELTVTCDADFAGTTITCTDGVTTLTQTCPSSSPYEVVFEIPNGGDWTISGVVGGHTVSTGVNIPTSASLIATIQQTVTIHSAKEDTISYTDIDGATQTITFASGETSKQVTITIEPSGSSITFTSSVAKNPNNLLQDYSKTFTITTSTTDIYLMPDAVKTLYWWGYENEIEDCISANGWYMIFPNSWTAPTRSTNEISMTSSSSGSYGAVGHKNLITCNKFDYIAETTGTDSDGRQVALVSDKNSNPTTSANRLFSTNAGLNHYSKSVTSQNCYIRADVWYGRAMKLKALWYE